VMIGTTALQLLSGTWLLMSFERDIRLLYMGDDVLLTSLLIASILVTLLMIFFLVLLMKHDKRKYFIMSLASFVLVVGIMGWMRQELREVYLDPHLEDHPRTATSEVQEGPSIFIKEQACTEVMNLLTYMLVFLMVNDLSSSMVCYTGLIFMPYCPKMLLTTLTAVLALIG